MLLRRFGFRDTAATCYVGDNMSIQLTSAREPETATPQEIPTQKPKRRRRAKKQ